MLGPILFMRTGILADREAEVMRTGLDLLIRIIAVGICVLVLLFAVQGLESHALATGAAPLQGPASETVRR